MLQIFDQRYHPPDWSTKLIPKLYDRERECVGHTITSAGSFALTTDIWTCHHNAGLTVHCVDDNCNLQSHLLETV